jgi:hypothetical protein
MVRRIGGESDAIWKGRWEGDDAKPTRLRLTAQFQMLGWDDVKIAMGGRSEYLDPA